MFSIYNSMYSRVCILMRYVYVYVCVSMYTNVRMCLCVCAFYGRACNRHGRRRSSARCGWSEGMRRLPRHIPHNCARTIVALLSNCITRHYHYYTLILSYLLAHISRAKHTRVCILCEASRRRSSIAASNVILSSCCIYRYLSSLSHIHIIHV